MTVWFASFRYVCALSVLSAGFGPTMKDVCEDGLKAEIFIVGYSILTLFAGKMCTGLGVMSGGLM